MDWRDFLTPMFKMTEQSLRRAASVSPYFLLPTMRDPWIADAFHAGRPHRSPARSGPSPANASPSTFGAPCRRSFAEIDHGRYRDREGEHEKPLLAAQDQPG
jgi:hypothetical protein